MTIRLFTLLMCCFLFSNCDDTFLTDFEQHRPLAGEWESTQLRINSQTIVFDMDLSLKEDNTFIMYAYVLGKEHTRYVEYTWTGKWRSLESEDTFELTYDNNHGIIGYYSDTDLNQETYLLKNELSRIVLNRNQNNQQFQLILQRKE